MVRKHLLYILVSLFGCIGGAHDLAAQSPTAAQAITSLKNNITATPGFQASFTMTQPQATSGTITVSGNKFAIVTDLLSTWYDGTTQWTLSPGINEVSVLTPTPEELSEINPLLLLNNITTQYYCSYITDGSRQRVIQLRAKSADNHIASAVVTIDVPSNLPTALKITTDDNNTFDINLSGVKKLNQVDAAQFRFNQSAYPGVDIIDLR